MIAETGDRHRGGGGGPGEDCGGHEQKGPAPAGLCLGCGGGFGYPVGFGPAGATAHRPDGRPPAGRVPDHAVAHVQVRQPEGLHQPQAGGTLLLPVHAGIGQGGAEDQCVGHRDPRAERVVAGRRQHRAVGEHHDEGHGEQRGDQHQRRAGQQEQQVGTPAGGHAAEHQWDQSPGLQVPLEPAGPLPDQPLDLDDALLVHGRRAAVLVAPARGGQPDAQVQVLGQAAGPRGGPQRAQRGKPDELAVAAEPDAAQVPPPPLEHLGVDDELHVLHPGEHAAVPVVDPDADLHRAHGRVGEELGDVGEGMRVEMAVGVDHGDDHAARIPAGQPVAAHKLGDRVVQRLALALPGVRQLPAQQPHPLVGDAGHRRGRAVVGTVVDDHDGEVVRGHRQQPLQAAGDHQFLVQAGHQEDVELLALRGGRASGHGRHA